MSDRVWEGSPQEFLEKVDWEGGLLDYVCGYGGPVPEAMAAEAEELERAAARLEAAFHAYRALHGVIL
jgi:hypothetical protein